MLTQSKVDDVAIVHFNNLTEEGKRALRALLNYENEAVVIRYASDAEVPLDIAHRTFTALKQYLAVCAYMGGKRTPAKVIDECWHTFILHLKDYEEFCNRHLRGLMYHNPAIDNSGMDFYQKTREGAEALCGPLDTEMWPINHDAYARCISTKDPTPAVFPEYIREKTYV